MTAITFDCPDCARPVGIQPAGVLLVDGGQDASWFAYRCPSCRTLVDGPATAGLVAMLASVGCPVTRTGAGRAETD